jgi:hypothetical protein
LNDLFYNIRPYIAGADGGNRHDTLYLSSIIASVFNAIESGINFSNVSIEIDGVTYSQYTFGNTTITYGNYPYLEDLITP